MHEYSSYYLDSSQMLPYGYEGYTSSYSLEL